MSKKNVTSFRNASPPSGYTDIPTELAQDARLSWRDRGMLCEIISRIGSTEFSAEEFSKINNIKLDDLTAKIKLFADLGYIRLGAPKDGGDTSE